MADSIGMKRAVLILAALCLAVGLSAEGGKKLSNSAVGAGPAPAERGGVAAPGLGAGSCRLENDGDSLAFYALFALKPGELNGLLAQPRAVVDRLVAQADRLDYLAAGTVAPALAVGDAEQLVVGFTVRAGSAAYPLWYLTVPPKPKRGGQGTILQLSAAKPLPGPGGGLSLKPSDIDLPAAGVRIDGRFVDWLKYPDLLSFPVASLPQRVVQSGEGGSRAVPVEQSLSYSKAGTDVEHVRMARSGDDLMVMVSSHSVMGKGLSYLFRLYANDQESANRYALEIPVEDKGGPVLFWTAGRKEAQIVGNYAAADYYVEARFKLKSLPPALAKLFAGDWFFEVSSAWSDAAVSEEYYWGRVAASAVPKAD